MKKSLSKKHKNVADGAAGAIQKEGFGGGRSPPEGCPRVEAIEVSEFAIAFASYIEGDTGLLIILIVMAEERTDASIHDPLIQGSASP